jgi:hypothetical protein
LSRYIMYEVVFCACSFIDDWGQIFMRHLVILDL